MGKVTNLPDIIYDKTKITPLVDSPKSDYYVPFFKDADYFSNLDSYNSFLKSCEQAVRRSDRYSKYIRYLKKDIQLDRCQVLKNITDEDASIELHHGPIFTLYDICAIVLEYFLAKKWKITTFRIADAVLTEHQQDRVNCVMLSTTAHQEVHARNLFISLDQAWGDVGAFVRKYGPYMPEEYKIKYNEYIERSRTFESSDFGLFNLNDKLF